LRGGFGCMPKLMDVNNNGQVVHPKEFTKTYPWQEFKIWTKGVIERKTSNEVGGAGGGRENNLP